MWVLAVGHETRLYATIAPQSPKKKINEYLFVRSILEIF